MTSAFSTNDAECLARETEHSVHDAVDFEQIWDKQRLAECIKFIHSHQFNKVSILRGVISETTIYYSIYFHCHIVF